MARFEVKFNDTNDHHEHAWLGLKDGQVVTGFAGSNAADRWLAREEAHDMNLVDLAIAKGLPSAAFADLCKRMDNDKGKILTVLKGL